jgi:putative acetyltransferase
MNISYTFESSTDPAGVELVRRLDAYLSTLYAPVDQHLLTVEQLAEPGMRFLVVRRAGEAVACGALAPRTGYMEIKRMWVEPSARGLGLGKAILARLEEEATRLGFVELRLETGVHNAEAIALYESQGYVTIPRFGEYENSPLSLCYAKRIGGDR